MGLTYFDKYIEKNVLEMIPIPTLLIIGKLDGPLHYESMAIDKNFEGKKMITFDKSGHFVHHEEPERFNECVLDWIKQQ